MLPILIAIAKAAVTAAKVAATAAKAVGGTAAKAAATVGKGAMAAGKAVGSTALDSGSSALAQIGDKVSVLGKIDIPGTKSLGDIVGKGQSALSDLAESIGPHSASAGELSLPPAQLATPPVQSASPPVQLPAAVQEPANGLMDSIQKRAGPLSELSSGGSPQQPPPQAQTEGGDPSILSQLVDSIQGQPTQQNDLRRYGYDPTRYAAKNPVSQFAVKAFNSVPGLDLLGNAGRRVVDAYLGNPEVQAAKLRVLDETGQAKAEASQYGSMLDLMKDIWKTTAAGKMAMERQTQADEAAAGRVTTQQAGADRRVEEAQTGATTRTGMVAKQKTDADNLLLAKDIMSKWKGMTEQERFGSAAFLRSVFSDFPISETEMNGLTWTEEKMRMVSDWWKKKFGGGSKTAGPTSAPGTPPSRDAGTKAREQDELGKLLFGGGL